MNSATTPVKLGPDAKEVLQTVRSWIVDHYLEPGSRLPSERDLARRLQVSQRQVQAALKQLLEEGLIQQVSQRIRIVAPDWEDEVSLFASTVVLISTVQFATLSSTRSAANMTETAFLGTANAVQQAGLNFIAVNPKQLTAGQVNGLIKQNPMGVLATGEVMTLKNASILSRLHDAGIPVVANADTVTDKVLDRLPFDTVHSDHRTGTRLLCERLYERGCRRIVRFWNYSETVGDQVHWVAERRRGYAEACTALGLEQLPPILAMEEPHLRFETEKWFRMHAQAAAGFLMDHLNGPQPVDGILLVNDGAHAHVATACRKLGKEPGKDVLIAGYDNFYAAHEGRQWESTVPAATIDKHDAGIGRAAFDLLQERVSGKLPQAPQRRLVDVELVIPKSS